eukprot:c9775_g1_i1.p1 GENE.c9775_g1_i1~~c9775_g1_i1.p1  ORF type:complete len:244 (-),score=42.20 c9775_g1_i1:980-1711(-)
MSMSKHNKMFQWLNYRMKITIQDNRTIIGTFLAFDKHMNLVLADAEEFRVHYAKKKGEEREERRSLGLTLIRGECVISLSVDGPPPSDDASKFKAQAGIPLGPGMGRAAGRGMPMPSPMAAPGLAGPARGVGGPGAAMMAPTPVAAASAVSYGRGAPVPPGPPMMFGRGGPTQPPPPMFAGRGAPFPPPPGMMMTPGMMPPGMPGMPPAMFGRGAPPPPGAFGRGAPPPPGYFPPGGPPPPAQ